MTTGEFDIGQGYIRFILYNEMELHVGALIFGSVTSLIEMFGTASLVLENIIDNAIDSEVRLKVDGAYNAMISFDFVFALHLLYEVMGITDILCQALQRNRHFKCHEFCLKYKSATSKTQRRWVEYLF